MVNLSGLILCVLTFFSVCDEECPQKFERHLERVVASVSNVISSFFWDERIIMSLSMKKLIALI